MKSGLLLLAAILMTGCAAQHSGNSGTVVSASTGEVSKESLAAFQTTVNAYGQQQGCVKCHSESVNPTWMHRDLLTAYSFAKPFLNVEDPVNSLFAVYVSNGHCADPICMDPSQVPIMQDLLLQWATVELNQNGGMPSTPGMTLSNPPYKTAAVAIPASLPPLTSNSVAVMRFDLSQMTPAIPALNGAILEISIKSYNSLNTTYKVFNPRLVGNTSAVTLTGLHVYVRPASGSGLGTEDIAQGLAWSQISSYAPIRALPSPLPAGPFAVPALTGVSMGVASQSAADVITIGFAQIQTN